MDILRFETQCLVLDHLHDPACHVFLLCLTLYRHIHEGHLLPPLSFNRARLVQFLRCRVSNRDRPSL